MLFYTTVEERTLQLLKSLQSLPQLKNFSLVGGTSLALQIGHRLSIDLDLFSDGESSIEGLVESLSQNRTFIF